MVDATIPMIIERLGFADVLLWLLTFAIFYGVLSQVKIPKSNASRGIISIIVGFLVLMAAPAKLIGILSVMSSNLLLIVLGILVLLIFIEVSGVKFFEGYEKDKEGNVKIKYGPLTEKYGTAFAIILIIIAILVFVGAGGLDLLGWKIALGPLPMMSTLFFVVLILAIFWMVAEKPKE